MSRPNGPLQVQAGEPSVVSTGRRACWFVGVALLLLPLAVSCGGGGGGGGGGGPGPKTGAGASISLVDIAFQDIFGVLGTQPPVEDLNAQPATLGAPLNQLIVFRFDGEPDGPFNSNTLPVFTTPQTVSPAAQAPPLPLIILAKGSYLKQGNTVEFRPSVPTAPLQATVSAPADAQPGLLPNSLYTARVTASGNKITNLQGPGGEVSFGTTSNTELYYPKAGDELAPSLVSSAPADGFVGFSPSSFGTVSLLTGQALFPSGPREVVLSYDHELLPTSENLLGKDLDGDGLVEANFFLTTQGTELLVAHEVPVNTFGVHAAFPAISGVTDGVAPEIDGGDVFLHGDGSGALPLPELDLGVVPSTLAVALEPDLVFGVLPVAGGSDLLTVVDHVLGDPSYAAMAEGGGGVLDTGLSDLTGLVSLLDGRLLVFDRGTRRVYELLPTVVRQRAAHGGISPAAPSLLSLTVGDGTNGFRSEVFDPSLEVLDLAQAPSGQLFALARVGGAAAPNLVLLEPLHLADGSAGTYSGDPAKLVLTLGDGVVDVVFRSERELLALDRALDRIDRYDPLSGYLGTAVSGVAAFGHPLGTLPDGESPARALAVGRLELDLAVSLDTNSGGQADVRLSPRGVLPPGRELRVMQRVQLTSLGGVNTYNSDPEGLADAWGSLELLSIRTADALAGPNASIDDVFLEQFDDDDFEDTSPTGLAPPAEWAVSLASGNGKSGGLRASVGVPDAMPLGDFLPLAEPEYLPNLSYIRSSGSKGEPDLDNGKANYHLVFLDTDFQLFPLADGSTSGITTPTAIAGGNFVFRDVIIPEGVRIVARGSRPLMITATRTLELHGLIDAAGTSGFSDSAFDSGIVPIAGGPGGPGAGRGGDSHPALFDPSGPGTLAHYVTPETGDHGLAPVVKSSGAVTFEPVGGRGGLSTLGYNAAVNGLPKLTNGDSTEHHRPGGGGGGSFYQLGWRAHSSGGPYVVQSNSTWFPFDKCPLDDKRNDALYGNDEAVAAGVIGAQHTQCVHMLGTLSDPDVIQPGAVPGDAVFKDGDPDNDFFGPGGELGVLIGGQGGGGGGSRIDSMRHSIWGNNVLGNPLPSPPAPPYFPKLQVGSLFVAPSVYDSRGGGGGGGGGSVLLRSFGDILISRTGHVDASGGHGGGGEMIQNSNWTGGGGGGSGGAIIVQAAGQVRIEADADHISAGFIDAVNSPTGPLQGASLDVSGGFGRDARTLAAQATQFVAFFHDHNRGDGGLGGFGLIQVNSGDASGLPHIEEGAFLFARQKAIIKQGLWSGDAKSKQSDHPEFGAPTVILQEDYRYIDMLHYRHFDPQGPMTPRDRFFVLNGAYPPVIPSTDGVVGLNGLLHEFPAGSGQLWSDTLMVAGPMSGGVPVVQEPEPELVMKTYNGWNPTNFKEINNPSSDPDFPGYPGTAYAGEAIPYSVHLKVPDGTPKMIMDEDTGALIVDPVETLSRLPLVHPSKSPLVLGSSSLGVSKWLNFNGVAVRARDAMGRLPPFFRTVHGTHNASFAPPPPDKLGHVQVGAPVPTAGVSAHYVKDAGFAEPGLNGSGLPGEPPFNDVKVDAPDVGVLIKDVVTDNAFVLLEFQAAHPVRAGSHVPDPGTLTPWLADLTELDGHELVRFRVHFDLSADPTGFPFGVSSFRPQVDYVRVRMDY